MCLFGLTAVDQTCFLMLADCKIILYFFSIKPEEKPTEKVIPCQSKNRWILPPDAKFVNSLDRQAAEELIKG